MNHSKNAENHERRRNRIAPEPRLAIIAGPFRDERLGAETAACATRVGPTWSRKGSLRETAACATRVGLVPVVVPPTRLVVDPRERSRAVCAIIDGEDPAARLCSTICSLLMPRAKIIFLFSTGVRPPGYLMERGECVAKPLTPFALRELLL